MTIKVARGAIGSVVRTTTTPDELTQPTRPEGRRRTDMARKTAAARAHLGVVLRRAGDRFGLVALAGTWKPELGLDLQGGTRITLVAKGDPSAEPLDEAR